VFKAFQTRVGAGPMPTELDDEIGDAIREYGEEYGTVTHRPRRCGWFDAVAGRLSKRVNGFTSIAITRLDILDMLQRIRICTGYKVDGKIIEDFPASATVLEKCQPVYEELPGWEAPTGDIRIYKELPPKAQRYVKRLEELIGCPASLISVGKRREQTIVRRSIFG
jgi:adenylosuccinate synthase